MICVINMVVYSTPSGTYYKLTLIFCNDELGVLDEGNSRNVARTKFYIYVFITITESTYLLVDYSSPSVSSGQ
jgi:hypothetical protein